MKNTIKNNNNSGEIIIYEGADGAPRIQAQMKDETVWLTQDQMAELFDKGRSTITEHIQNVFKEGELDEKVVSSILEHTTIHGVMEGKTQIQSVKFYNLETTLKIDITVKDIWKLGPRRKKMQLSGIFE